MSDREKRLIGSDYGTCRPPHDFPKLIDWAMNGRLDLESLVTRTIPIERINTALETMDRGEAGRTVVLFD